MAKQSTFRYQNIDISKIEPLGHGSYGAVYKAKCDQLPCAAKIFRLAILDPHDPESQKIMQKFEEECSFLCSIRHPHIVQYLGTTRDPNTKLPVLLMELLDESLTKMLEHSQQPLAYHVQVDLCHDIALAIAYLHSNDIIHRDLSSNNVLIIAGRRAKVTDFGMSKLADAVSSLSHVNTHLPPEALKEPPIHTKKLDCFSEGVIMIQVCTQLWPEPGPRTQNIPFPASPTGSIEMPVLETERRKNHIEMIDSAHPLLSVAMDCLKFKEDDRPSAEELCQRLADLKEKTEYSESVQQLKLEPEGSLAGLTGEPWLSEPGMSDEQIHKQLSLKERQIQRLREENNRKERTITDQAQQLQEKDEAIVSKENQLWEKEEELQEIKKQLRKKEKAMGSKNRELDEKDEELQKLYQQLSEHQQASAEIQQTNYDLQRQVEGLKQQKDYHSQLSHRTISQGSPKTHTPGKPPKMELTWRNEGRAPIQMKRGSSIVAGDLAFFMHCDGRVCSYNSLTKKWSVLPYAPYHESGLAVINGLLTTIGGCSIGGVPTDKLFSLKKFEGEEGRWVEHFPHMPTERFCTAVVSTEYHVIVAGGMRSKRNHLVLVEVMDAETLVWSTSTNLPYPVSAASATICRDQLYLLGGWHDRGKIHNVLTCSVNDIIRTQPTSWAKKIKTTLSLTSVWQEVASSPAVLSTCVAVEGVLLSIGGHDSKNKDTAAVHKYNPTTNTWDLVNHMSIAHYCCLAAALPTGKLMVVGGVSGIAGIDFLNSVSVAHISYN